MRVPQSYLQGQQRLTAWLNSRGLAADAPARFSEEGDWLGPVSSLVYPPVGFLQWSNICEVGNGDYFGYYWPLGKESEVPIVCMLSHDCWALIPRASTIEKLALLLPWQRDLIEYRPKQGATSGRTTLSLAEQLAIDERSPFLLVANADAAFANSEMDKAESLYQRALAILPEYTAAQMGLVYLYRRWRKPQQAAGWMLEALRSPFCFWGASFWAETNLPNGAVNRDDYWRKCLLWLRQTKPFDAIADDPLYQHRHELRYESGLAENPDYAILVKGMDDYVALGRNLDAVRLAMLYGERMSGETTPFRERNGFSQESHRLRLLKYFKAANLQPRAALLERSDLK
jgi:hypothetical protein